MVVVVLQTILRPEKVRGMVASGGDCARCGRRGG